MATSTVVPTPAATVLVPVSSPAHPSHVSWLQILETILAAAISIGPAVVAVTDPSQALLAGQLGQIAGVGLGTIAAGLKPAADTTNSGGRE